MATSYQCTEASGSRAEPMFATASQVRGWLMTEVRGAWGVDAIHDSAFGVHVPANFKNGLKQRLIRAVCIRSHLRNDDDRIRLFACAARRPGRGPTKMFRRDVDSLDQVLDAAAVLAVNQAPDSGWEQVDETLLLVCTNGRHDQCCANLGRPLMRALRESPWADRVWECSHVGGDRFAANLVVLPHSLYFGRVTPEHVTDLLAGVDEGRIDLDHFRGRTSFNLAEQAVEHFVRQEFGLDGLDDVVVDTQTSDGAFSVSLGERLVRVRLQRRMVTVADPLTCKGSADQLVPQFTLRSIE